MQPKVWLITGTSTGFGRELAQVLIERGQHVVATARKPETVRDLAEQAPERVLAVALDVTKSESIANALKAAIERFGRIDVLVNNAGYGQMGAIEELTEEEIRAQFETNVFGLIAVTQAVLPHMRQARSGHIVNISSMAGFRGVAGMGAYNASKFAVEGVSEALAHELSDVGVKVTIVEPGAFRTKWAAGGSLLQPKHLIAEYAKATAVRERISGYSGNQLGDPRRGAEAIIDAVNAEKPPLRLVLGADALTAVRAKLDAVRDEVTVWESVSLATTFDTVSR
jgi:NAD(P)-dependent dehydrogenase (short-subunit alcohol dehydrogenase family)